MTKKIKTLDRVNIFGTKFSVVDLELATKFLTMNTFDKPEYFCFPSTDTISKAYKDNTLQNIINGSCIVFTDGKITEYYLRIKGIRGVKNVSGYWLMENLLKTNLRHFFYGCDDLVLTKLKKQLLLKHPDANIIGFKAPPMVNLSNIYFNNQIIKDFEEINKMKPDVIWIGLSTPKQDYLMFNYKNYLDKGVMLGVGAVFLYQAGIVNKGPEWIKKLGLRWLVRLLQNPLWIIKTKVPGYFYFFYLIIKHDILRIRNT